MGARVEHAFAVIPPGLEAVLAAELRDLGIQADSVEGGVLFPATPEALWRVHLHARTPARVWLRVNRFQATTLDQLARRVRELPWARFVHPRQPVKARVSAQRSRLRHRETVGNKVELAVQDALRGPRRSSGRPVREPLEVLVRIVDDVVELSVDASGEALYRRGWRRDVGEAPLRENLAAAVLRLVDWRPGEALVDPMCGSGTFPIEAATLAAGRPPGVGRRFAFERWPEHDARAFQRLASAARGRAVETVIVGADADATVLRAARANADRARVRVTLVHRRAGELEPPGAAPGLVVANPPWGARIGGAEAAWRELGEALRARFGGWRVALLVPDRRLLRIARLDLPRVGGFSSGGVRLSVHTGPVRRS